MRRHLALLVLALPVSFAFARLSPNISPSSPIYDVIERLEAARCAYTTFRSMGPQAYEDLRSAVDVGEGQKTEDGSVARCDIPNWLRKERDLFLRGAPLSMSTTALFLRNDDVPLLGLDTSVTPSYPRRGGRETFNGPNLYVELDAGTAGGGDDFGVAAGVTPGFLLGYDNYQNLDSRFYLQEGYVKVGYKWTELTLGRTAMKFGSATHGTLLLSEATKPFSVLKLGIRPHLLGAPFRFLGPFTFETWVSTEGDSHFINDSRYWGISLGIRPLPWFEMAFLELYQLGGTGTPSLQFTDYLKLLVYLGDSDLDTKRQREFAANFAFWFPDHALKLYFQFMFDKISSITQDVSPLVGLWVPWLAGFDFRLELVHTTQYAYESPIWKQGFAYQSTPVGSPLGPDADGVYLDIGLPALGDWRPGLYGSYEARGKHLSGNQATEKRAGVGASLAKRWVKTTLTLNGRYTHFTNQDYVPGALNDSLAGYVMMNYAF